MSLLGFDQFFTTATGKERSFEYQRRLACGDDGCADQPAMLGQGHECRSLLINVPTGLCRTALLLRG